MVHHETSARQFWGQKNLDQHKVMDYLGMVEIRNDTYNVCISEKLCDQILFFQNRDDRAIKLLCKIKIKMFRLYINVLFVILFMCFLPLLIKPMVNQWSEDINNKMNDYVKARTCSSLR